MSVENCAICLVGQVKEEVIDGKVDHFCDTCGTLQLSPATIRENMKCQQQKD